MFSDSVLVHGAGVLSVIAVLALVLKVVQRRHSPYSPQDGMVLAALAAYALEWAIIVPGIAGFGMRVAGPLVVPSINLVALFVEQYCVAGFLLLATESRRGVRWLSALFVVAMSGLLVLIGLGALDRPAGSLPASSAAVVLNVWIGVYAIAATQVAVVMAWRHSKQTRQPVTTALRMIACSLTVVNISATIGASISTELNWLGHPFPVWIPYWAKNFTTAGIAGFLVAACLPAVVGSLAAIRRGWARHRAYLDLDTLWRALTVAFPQTTLQRAPNTNFVALFSWSSPERRYYRRAVECRDGLLQISPYLPDDVGADPLSQASALRAALRARQKGATPTGAARLFAAPSQPDFDGDGAALRALSRALSGVGSMVAPESD